MDVKMEDWMHEQDFSTLREIWEKEKKPFLARRFSTGHVYLCQAISPTGGATGHWVVSGVSEVCDENVPAWTKLDASNEVRFEAWFSKATGELRYGAPTGRKSDALFQRIPRFDLRENDFK